MNHKSNKQIRKLLYGIVLAGMVLSLCFGMSGSSVVRAQAAGTEPPMIGSLPVKGQAWSQSGWFNMIWGDSLEGASSTAYTLTGDLGQTTVLLLDETLAQSMGGVLSFNRRYVSVQGVWADSPSVQSAPAGLNVTSISIAQSPGTKVLGGIAPLAVTGSQPWISILCKFSDHAEEPRNLPYFQGMYAGTKPGLDHYWRELSYDIINLAGSNASGWFELPHPEAYYNPTDKPGGTNIERLAKDCIAAADASVDFSLYIGINMMFNTDFDNGYAWGGSTYMNLDGASRFWSRTYEPPWAYSSISNIAHEMGHGFGLPHSSGDYGQVYDNAWDVMSCAGCGSAAGYDPVYGILGQHTISFHKDILGWIPAGQKFTAGQNINTTITLEQLALPTNTNYKMVKIPIKGSSTHFYTVEARRLAGYDVKLPGDAVIIHDVDTTSGIPAHLIDADVNGNTTDAGAMWTVGETFLDPTNDISVHVDSATATGFQVTITTPPFWTISGYVRTSYGANMSGVTMSGLPHNPKTDASGYYSDQVINGWSGTVTPQKLNSTFSPTSLSYSNVLSNQADQNYNQETHQVYLPLVIR